MVVRYGPWQKITHKFSDINIILLSRYFNSNSANYCSKPFSFFFNFRPTDHCALHIIKYVIGLIFIYSIAFETHSVISIYIESAILWQPLKSTIQVRCCLVAKTGIYLIVIFGQHYIYLLGNRLHRKNDLAQVFLLTKVKSISNHSKSNWNFFSIYGV